MESSSYLHCESISHKFENYFLFENLSFKLHSGSKLGIIGENGSGKSTLLSILSHNLIPVRGNVAFSEEPVLIAQENSTLDESKTLGDYINDCLEYSNNIVKEIEKTSILTANGDKNSEIYLSSLLEEADRKEVWSAHSKMEKYLHKFNIKNFDRDKRISSFSAGQKKRIILCLETFKKPNILILDEPSNYLDKRSRDFLIKEMKDMKGIVIFTSHDREFLSEIPTAICDIDKNWSSPYIYKGNYGDYVSQKKFEYEKWVEKFNAQEENLKELQNKLDTKPIKVGHNSKMKDNNKLAHKAKGERVDAQLSKKYRAIKESIKNIQNNAVPRPIEPLRLSLPTPKKDKLGHGTIMELVNVELDSQI